MTFDERISFGFAQAGGTRLHFARAGSGDRLVMLLHGFPECWYSWRHQLLALSGDYTVVAPDLRGYNLSDRPSDVSDYRVEKLADDVIALIGHLGFEKAAVIGHDWGAAIAWYIGLHHPEYLTKLGAFQVPPPAIWKRNLTTRQLLASWYMFFFQLPRVPEWLLARNGFAGLKRAFTEKTAERGVFTITDLAVYEDAWRQPGALTAMLNYYRANVFGRLLGPKTIERRVTVPTLFVYGQRDTAVIPDTVRGVGDAVEATFENYLIPQSGHWIQQEIPEEINRILREFLAR